MKQHQRPLLQASLPCIRLFATLATFTLVGCESDPLESKAPAFEGIETGTSRVQLINTLGEPKDCSIFEIVSIRVETLRWIDATNVYTVILAGTKVAEERVVVKEIAPRDHSNWWKRGGSGVYATRASSSLIGR